MEPLKKDFGGDGRRLLGGSAPREALSLTRGLPPLGEQVIRQAQVSAGQVRAQGNKVGGESSSGRCPGIEEWPLCLLWRLLRAGVDHWSRISGALWFWMRAGVLVWGGDSVGPVPRC